MRHPRPPRELVAGCQRELGKIFGRPTLVRRGIANLSAHPPPGTFVARASSSGVERPRLL